MLSSLLQRVARAAKLPRPKIAWVAKTSVRKSSSAAADAFFSLRAGMDTARPRARSAAATSDA
jgi:hypothetical protein